jgi:hypothetical protein
MDDLENETTPATRRQLLKVAEALGMTMNGIECVPTHELVEWCALGAEARLEARRRGREAEVSTPEGFSLFVSIAVSNRGIDGRLALTRPRH